jgi:hypothetical protein
MKKINYRDPEDNEKNSRTGTKVGLMMRSEKGLTVNGF